MTDYELKALDTLEMPWYFSGQLSDDGALLNVARRRLD